MAIEDIGDLLPDDVVIYRAFSDKSFRERSSTNPPGKVKRRAYLRPDKDTDGLSVGLSPKDAVDGLASNEGYCSIKVGYIHQKLKRGIEVRADKAKEGHAFIVGLPFLISDDDRAEAMDIARLLAANSKCETCDPYKP